MSLCLSHSMTDTSKAKECLEESDTSFLTSPSDDGFRFSNLTTSHMSMLKESGPFIAIVLSYWDNLLGPRLQHVWRGAGDTESQVGVSLRMIFVFMPCHHACSWYSINYDAIENKAHQSTAKPLYILRYPIFPSCAACISY